jgi:hypothetical protein
MTGPFVKHRFEANVKTSTTEAEPMTDSIVTAEWLA